MRGRGRGHTENCKGEIVCLKCWAGDSLVLEGSKGLALCQKGWKRPEREHFLCHVICIEKEILMKINQ